jgi:phage terminase large subunit-like protein
MVEHVIRTVDKSVSYTEVTASRGKVIRAEPVAALYEQKRVTHIGDLAALEDQMCAMTSDGYALEGSPDRLDAAVWALDYLMFTARAPLIITQEMVAKSAAPPTYRRKRLG